MKKILLILAIILCAMCAEAQTGKIARGLSRAKTAFKEPRIKIPRVATRKPPYPFIGPTMIEIDKTRKSTQRTPLTFKVPTVSPPNSKTQKNAAQKAKKARKARKDMLETIERTNKYMEILNLQSDDPATFLKLACEAISENDESLARLCIRRAILTKKVTAETLLTIKPQGDYLQKEWTHMSQYIINSTFLSYANAKLWDNVPQLKQKEFYNSQLQLANTYAPELTPLVKIIQIPYTENATAQLTEAVDSAINNHNAYYNQVTTYLFGMLNEALTLDGHYQTALDYYSKPMLKTFADTVPPVLVNLSNCAIHTKQFNLANKYLARAKELDPTGLENAISDLHHSCLNTVIDHPEEVQIAEWMIENSGHPVECAIEIIDGISTKFMPINENWEWQDVSSFTPHETTVLNTCIALAQKVLASGNEENASHNAQLLYLTNCSLLAQANQTETATQHLQSLQERLAHETDSESMRTKCLATLVQAAIAGHGSDYPKKAIKILKANQKMLDDEGISPDLKADYYGYMAHLYSKLGKKKESKKYKALQSAYLPHCTDDM